MSKNTNHYNWQNWVSQTKIKNKKEKVLNEMYQHWVDAIMPDIIKASNQKNTNFKYFFGNEGNRIVVPFSTSKVTQLAHLIKLCEQLVWRRYNKEKDNYIEKIKQTYKIQTAHTPEDLSKLPEILVLNHPAWGLELVVPTIKESDIKLQQKIVKQKVALAGGGTTEQDVTIYEPIFTIIAYVPFSVKTPIDVVETAFDETGKKARTKTEKLTIGQILQSSNERELFNWWQQNQAQFSQDQEAISEAIELKGEIDSFAVEKTKLLFENALTSASDLSIIISRSPIDVLRMSDFRRSGINSCHSQPEEYGGGSYFYCALAEARNQGAIAYLVNTKDLEKVNLNDTEIFEDPQRNVKGIVPISRNRLRRVVDRTTSVDLMAVEGRTYGAKKIGFVDSINKWVSKKLSKLIMNDPSSTAEEGRYYVPEGDGLALLGGSYTDSGLRGLADNLVQNLNSAADLLAEQGEQESDVTYLKSVIEDFDVSITSNEIEYEGDEDESEIENQCDADLFTQAEEEYNGNADYSTLSLQYECNGRILESVTSTIQIEVEISNVGDAHSIKFNSDKVEEIKRNESLRRELEDQITTVFQNMVKNSYNFNSSQIEATMNLTVYSTGTSVYSNIQIICDHATLDEAKSYAYSIRRELRTKMDPSEITQEIKQLFEEINLIKPNVNETEEIQDVIQKFAEHLPAVGNHFAWDDTGSTETKGEVEDAFILVADPKRASIRTNYPIVGKIPAPLKETNGRKILDRVMLNKIVERIETSYQSGELIKKEIYKKYGDYSYTHDFENQLELFKNLPLQPEKDFVADYVPTVQGIRTSFLVVPEELSSEIVNDEFIYNEQDYINVRLYFSVGISGAYDTEQQILNTLSFMEKAGSQKEYEEIIKICSEVFRKLFNSLKFPNPYLGFMKDSNKEEEELIAATEKAARTPSTSTIKTPSNTSSDPLFTGEPLRKDQYLPENKTKKLVINERFKHLLRNIKK